MRKFAVLLLLLLIADGVSTEQKTFYDAAGHSIGTATTDSQGSTTFRDASGRVIGRSSTDRQGNTTLYDSSGRDIGKSTAPRN